MLVASATSWFRGSTSVPSSECGRERMGSAVVVDVDGGGAGRGSCSGGCETQQEEKDHWRCGSFASTWGGRENHRSSSAICGVTVGLRIFFLSCNDETTVTTQMHKSTIDPPPPPPFCRDPGAAIPIFGYQALHSLPHLQHLHPPHGGILKASSSAAAAAAGGGVTGGGRGVGVGADRRAGLLFEGLYEEPSLGHLVGLVRYYVHQMEIVSNEEVSSRRSSRRVCSGGGGGVNARACVALIHAVPCDLNLVRP